MQLTRRDALMMGAGAVAATLIPAGAPRAAPTLDEAIAAFTGGATPAEGGVTITAPEIAENGNTVPIEVEAPGASSIMLLADGNPNPAVCTFHFGPLAGAQMAATRIRLAPHPERAGGGQACRWQLWHRPARGEGHHRRLRRLTPGSRRAPCPASSPRVKVPKSASAGEVITIKTLINHQMESGQRKDSSGNVIPRKIINRFACTFNGQEVISVDIDPAVSANPYFEFQAKIPEAGEFVFTWVDDDGTVYEERKEIAIG
ncbi:MAG: hypothetical protein KatS3mg118_1697 [Paracoccaceae bacterium]|nr:MAG: hypothetical protein KatS3mg118_1697 [Paracoccaceae bacterium]